MCGARTYVRRKVQETSFARVYLCTWTRYARVSIAIAMSAFVLVTSDLKLNSHVRILWRSWKYVRSRVFLHSQRKIAAEDLAVILVRGPKSNCIFTSPTLIATAFHNGEIMRIVFLAAWWKFFHVWPRSFLIRSSWRDRRFLEMINPALPYDPKLKVYNIYKYIR